MVVKIFYELWENLWYNDTINSQIDTTMPKPPFSYLVLPLRLPIKTLAWLTMSLMYAQYAHASGVRNDIDYQEFRDFAENKGKFVIGATNVVIKDKQGNPVGTMLSDIPMPDLAAIGASGVSTLVDDQYMLSVAHNGGYRGVVFGSNDTDNHSDTNQYTYKIVDNNNYPKGNNNYPLDWDYHLPRLHKMVTEVTPIPATNATSKELAQNRDRYDFVRAGSGTQTIEGVGGVERKSVGGGNAYLTGGVPFELGHRAQWIDGGGKLFGNRYGPMVTVGLSGDSGSGLFVYDKVEGSWNTAATLNFMSDRSNGVYANTWSLARPDYNQEKQNEDIGAAITADNQTLTWSQSQTGSSTLSYEQNGQTIQHTIGLFNPNAAPRNGQNDAQQNQGKTLIITGENNVLQVNDSINQGAGGIYFNGNTTVTSPKNSTWQGAGVVVANDKTVDWQVKNPKDDRLSKLGKGTLQVSGTGINEGDISVGDGKVILNQKENDQGQKQAFNKLGIVSGRGTVVVGDGKQMNWDKLYFGFRGGRLDANGQTIEFNRIANVDEGAQIVNHSANPAAVNIGGYKDFTEDDIVWGGWKAPNADVYVYDYAGRKDYFFLKTRPNEYFPQNKQSNPHWEYIGTNEEGKQEAIKRTIEKKNTERKLTAFNGFLGENDPTKGTNGELNITFAPHIADASLLLTGGSDINGTLSATGGTLMLSGRPTPHAYNHQQRSEVIIDGDWQNRTFKATAFDVANNAQLVVGRNVSELIGNLNVSDTATVKMGFDQGDKHCLRSDRTGTISCAATKLSPADMGSWGRTQFTGDATLSDSSQVAISGKTDWLGKLSADDNTTVRLNSGSHWTLTGDSTAGKLELHDATITLNSEYNQDQTTQAKPAAWNLLKVGSLSGNGRINYLSDVASKNSDKIEAQEASGNFELYVKDTGEEPKHPEYLKLFSFKSGDPKLELINEDQTVDLGAYKYELKKQGDSYVLYNEQAAKAFAPPPVVPAPQPPTSTPVVVPPSSPTVSAPVPNPPAQQPPAPTMPDPVQAVPVPTVPTPNPMVSVPTVPNPVQPSNTVAQPTGQTNPASTANPQPAAQQNSTTATQNTTTQTQSAQQTTPTTTTQTPPAQQSTPTTNPVVQPTQSKPAPAPTTPNTKPAPTKPAVQPSVPVTTPAPKPQSELISRNSNIALSEASNQANLLAGFGALDVATLKEQQAPWTVWAQRTWQAGHYTSPYHRDYRSQHNLNQIGMNAKQGLFDVGLSIVQAQSVANYEGVANKTRASDVNAYGKYTSPTGTTFAINVGTSHSTSTIGEVAITRQSPHFGAIIAHTWRGENVKLQPYLGARVYAEPASSYTLAGSRIHTQKTTSLYSYAGLVASKDFSTPYGRLSPSFATHMDNERDNIALSVNDRPLQHKTNRAFTHRLGLGADLGKYLQINASLGYRHGADIKSQSDASVRVDYRW